MPESFKTCLLRWGFNFFPAYRRTGARITHIAADFREVRIRLPLNWKTRNYMGTLFGGSMYAAVDPIYTLMLIKILGPDFLVWDKAAVIRFRKPGRSTLYARFFLPEGEIAAIGEALRREPKTDRRYQVELTDAQGVVHAVVDKTVHIRLREAAEKGRPSPRRFKSFDSR